MPFSVAVVRGIIGLVALIAIAVLFSSDRKNIKWKLVGYGVLLQVIFALLVLKFGPGRAAFAFAGEAFSRILTFTQQGSDFIFGPLAISPGQDGSLGPIFAFQILPTIVFFASLMGVLYHYRLIQPLVKGMGWLMAKTLGISGAEALSAAANVFVGQTEAPLVVKPYIEKLTRSEMMTLMCGGMATVAGGVLAAYVVFLGGSDSSTQALFAAHLLSASIMSAPAAIVMAKILIPEIDAPETLGQVQMAVERTEINGLEAAAAGAGEGLKLALNVGAMLLAFLALLAMINWMLNGIGEPTGLNGVVESASGGAFDALSVEAIFGFVFAPLAWLMGIESGDILQFGRLMGEKIAVNEFVAFTSLGDLKGVVSERTLIIGTYALCGFANFSSIAIQIGGIGGIAPSRRSDIASLGLRAVIGGALASWMTATIAGVLAV